MLKRLFGAALVALSLTGAVSAAPVRIAIIGDCLATKPYGLGGQFSKAIVDGTVGVNSTVIVSKAQRLGRSGQTVTDAVISTGSNDITRQTPARLIPGLQAKLRANLAATKAALPGVRLIFLRPALPAVGDVVARFAAENGDKIQAFTPGRDGVHPQNYRTLALDVAKQIGN